MEADVNVLVVGRSTARRGAIGRHLPFPLIRRCPKPGLRRRLLRFPRAGRTREAGRGPPSGVVGAGWEERVCLCVRRVAGVDLPFLFINMADLRQPSPRSRSSSRLLLPSPTWRAQPYSLPGPPKGSGTTASL